MPAVGSCEGVSPGHFECMNDRLQEWRNWQPRGSQKPQSVKDVRVQVSSLALIDCLGFSACVI